MAAGRPLKPTALKRLGGTLQLCRTNAHEPVSAVLLPTPPAWLSDKARQYWAEIGAVLLDMKLCTVADGPALQLLTETLAEWAEARQAVHTKGLVYETKMVTGDIMQRPVPEVAIASDAMKRSLRMLAEFGLTPASRGKVSALGDDDGLDPFAQMLEDMKG
ncbi:phage terminase small subunit P27 family [Hymenobacter nivis]|uniref:Phage terminase small subunit P27 family n=1 Tax=Hymenobacter nivis TaxID=1850093 RepID=A0A2Z3GZI8_9BACT|nr:phage terminase small subunit P27 family [Hymenobacter nivis]AWM34190.1 phage terminase small subunit P27 family [Hymenobacter nivis]